VDRQECLSYQNRQAKHHSAAGTGSLNHNDGKFIRVVAASTYRKTNWTLYCIIWDFFVYWVWLGARANDSGDLQSKPRPFYIPVARQLRALRNTGDLRPASRIRVCRELAVHSAYTLPWLQRVRELESEGLTAAMSPWKLYICGESEAHKILPVLMLHL